MGVACDTHTGDRDSTSPQSRSAGARSRRTEDGGETVLEIVSRYDVSVEKCVLLRPSCAAPQHSSPCVRPRIPPTRTNRDQILRLSDTPWDDPRAGKRGPRKPYVRSTPFRGGRACSVVNHRWVGSHASALYETHASTLWTLVVKERSLTSSELAMYRGSLSSHACAQRGRWCWGGGAGRCAWVGGVRRVPHRALLAQGARAARHLRHVDVVVGVDEQVKGARLVEQRQEGDRGRDLPDDGLDL